MKSLISFIFTSSLFIYIYGINETLNYIRPYVDIISILDNKAEYLNDLELKYFGKQVFDDKEKIGDETFTLKIDED